MPRFVSLPRIPPVFAVACFLLLGGCVRQDDGIARIQFAVWGSTEQLKAEEAVVRLFEEANPDVKVSIITGGTRYTDKLQAMMVGNVAPDVFMVEITMFDEWATRGVLLDITEDMRALTAGEPLMPIPERAFTRGETAYALPINCHGLALYYNIDALEKVGIPDPANVRWTWDRFLEIAPRFSRRAGHPDAPTDFAALMPSFEVLVECYGASLFNDRFAPTAVTAGSPEFLEVMRLYRRIFQSNAFVPPDVSLDQGTFQLFRDGKVAFHFEGRWRTPDFRDIRNFRWNVTSHLEGPAGAITHHGGTGLSVWSGSKNQEAARRFIRFYASVEGSRLSMHGGRYVPPYRSAAFGEEFLSLRPPEGIQRWSETMEEGAAAIPLYAPGLNEIRRLLGVRVDQMIYAPRLSLEAIQSDLVRDLERWLERDLRRREQLVSR